jgi:hypothetical protein
VIAIAVINNPPWLGRKMNNSDENKHNINDNSEGEPEEIPYWLQGFEESIPDETTPIESDTKETETWIKESAISPSEEDIPPDSVLEEVEMEDEEGSKNETSFENEITGAEDDDEVTDEIEIDAIPADEIAEPVEPEPDELPSPEGFVDISDLDLPEPPHQEDEDILGVEAKQGQLPEWLQEMISEPDTSEIIETELAQLPDEEPVQDSVDEKDMNWEKEHLEDEIVEDESTPLEDIVEMEIIEIDQELEAGLTIADEDTTPISTIKEEDISSDKAEPEFIELETDETQSEPLETIVDKYPLDDLKYYLDQKNIQKALEIINELDDETTDFGEIAHLLITAAENDAQNKCDLLEAVGDIAMKQEKPLEALEAYTKAIGILLANDEGDDEIS